MSAVCKATHRNRDNNKQWQVDTPFKLKCAFVFFNCTNILWPSSEQILTIDQIVIVIRCRWNYHKLLSFHITCDSAHRPPTPVSLEVRTCEGRRRRLHLTLTAFSAFHVSAPSEIHICRSTRHTALVLFEYEWFPPDTDHRQNSMVRWYMRCPRGFTRKIPIGTIGKLIHGIVHCEWVLDTIICSFGHI